MSFGQFPLAPSTAIPVDGLDIHSSPAVASALLQNQGPSLARLLGLNVQERRKRPYLTDWSQVPKAASLWYDHAADAFREAHAGLSPGRLHWFDLTTSGLSDGDPTDPFLVPIYKAGQRTLAAEPGHTLAQALQLKRNPINDSLGGPTPLATALVGSALMGGLGYAGGAAIEKLLPRSVVGNGRLRRSLGIAGGIAGSTPGLYLGRLGSVADGTGYLEGLTSPGVLSGEKSADAGGSFVPAIPVDAFNRLVMDDPFTPSSVQAATTALTVSADRASGGSGIVSPAAIARIAIGAGAGYLQAYAGAQVLGTLAGLSPQAQQSLRQTGALAGALNAAVPGLFGLR